MRKIKATIRKDGTTKIEVLDAQGEGCLELTREMERRLGVQQGERELKDEFHEEELVEESEREQERG
jgi:hypothetical protein